MGPENSLGMEFGISVLVLHRGTSKINASSTRFGRMWSEENSSLVKLCIIFSISFWTDCIRRYYVIVLLIVSSSFSAVAGKFIKYWKWNIFYILKFTKVKTDKENTRICESYSENNLFCSVPGCLKVIYFVLPSQRAWYHYFFFLKLLENRKVNLLSRRNNFVQRKT